MSEFIRYVGWIFVVIGVAIIGVCVLFYYIARCIINREEWDEAKTETDKDCDGDNQYY